MQNLPSQSQSVQQPLDPAALLHIQHNHKLALTVLHLCSSLICITVGLQLPVASPWLEPDSHHFDPIGDLTYQMLQLYVEQKTCCVWPAQLQILQPLDSCAADLQIWVQGLVAADRSDYWQGFREQQQPSDASAFLQNP